MKIKVNKLDKIIDKIEEKLGLTIIDISVFKFDKENYIFREDKYDYHTPSGDDWSEEVNNLQAEKNIQILKDLNKKYDVRKGLINFHIVNGLSFGRTTLVSIEILFK